MLCPYKMAASRMLSFHREGVSLHAAYGAMWESKSRFLLSGRRPTGGQRSSTVFLVSTVSRSVYLKITVSKIENRLVISAPCWRDGRVLIFRTLI